MTTFQKRAKIAWRPITVYKVVDEVYKVVDECGHLCLKYMTLFRGTIINKSGIIEAASKDIVITRPKGNIFPVVTDEGVHACLTEKEAKELINKLDSRLRHVIVKGKVPRFTCYWINITNDRIAAKKLKLYLPKNYGQRKEEMA